MISVEEMRKLEGKAFASGVTADELMERAGKACADEIEKRLGSGKRIAIFIGPGNNGGDGLVAARYLKRKNKVTAIVVREPKTEAARRNYERARKAGVGFADTETADIIVDALLGIGTKGELRGDIRDACRRINSMEGFKVAIDLPSGLGADGKADENAVRADATICIHDCKEGCEKTGGEFWVVDIGL